MNRRPVGSAYAPPMPIDLTTTASEIRDLHKSAQHHGRRTVDFAQQTGRVLLAVKAALRHGEFIPWVELNCGVSARQVQRYMAAAKGRVPPPRKLLDGPPNNDTSASHLPPLVEAAAIAEINRPRAAARAQDAALA